MDQPAITIAKPEDRERLIRTAVLAFNADPVARWANPSAAEFLAAMPEFFDAFGGRAFEHGSAWSANDGEAIAMWLPPGVEPDDERMMQLSMANTPLEALEELAGFFGQMEQYHPTEPHWYLPIIGCDPHHLGRGLGAALMKAALERVDAEHMPAYLESSNPRNVSLYERHGFEVIGEIQHGSSPVMLPMFRAAR